MERGKEIRNLIIILVIIVLIIVFFFPKQYIKGGLGGFVGPMEGAYKEEYSCFGVKYSYYPKDCMDCGNIYLCFGLTYGKKCHIEKYLGANNISKETTLCR